jgi:hypothetical protein
MQMKQAGSPPSTVTLKDILFLPIGCLLTGSPFVVLGGLLVAFLLGLYAYNNLNVNILDIGIPDYPNYKITPLFDHIEDPDHDTWSIAYEKPFDSEFTGVVRHVSPIRMTQFPFLTHDILVTSGDYADSQKVTTSVIDHHFQWFSASNPHPSGAINLLHTVPKDKTTYDLLMKIRSGDHVKITGLEILKIDYYDPTGKLSMWWQDTGCNSLRVDDVQFIK